MSNIFSRLYRRQEPSDYRVVCVERVQDGSGAVVEKSDSTGEVRTRIVYNVRPYEEQLRRGQSG